MMTELAKEEAYWILTLVQIETMFSIIFPQCVGRESGALRDLEGGLGRIDEDDEEGEEEDQEQDDRERLEDDETDAARFHSSISFFLLVETWMIETITSTRKKTTARAWPPAMSLDLKPWL